MKRFLLGAAWLGLLAVYILIGVPYASYHGDETSQLYDSHVYATLFLKHNPQALLVEWPIDNELECLRLADSSVSRYTIGLAQHLAEYSESNLPNANFNRILEYAGNQALGLIPDQHLMVIMRLPSAIFLALSAAVIFGIGYRFGRLPMAFFVSSRYVLNPIILLNGRRVLQEETPLCFGLLTVWIGILINGRRERGKGITAPVLDRADRRRAIPAGEQEQRVHLHFCGLSMDFPARTTATAPALAPAHGDHAGDLRRAANRAVRRALAGVVERAAGVHKRRGCGASFCHERSDE